MLGLKLNHVSKRGHRYHNNRHFVGDRESLLAKIPYPVISWIVIILQSHLLPPSGYMYMLILVCNQIESVPQCDCCSKNHHMWRLFPEFLFSESRAAYLVWTAVNRIHFSLSQRISTLSDVMYHDITQNTVSNVKFKCNSRYNLYSPSAVDELYWISVYTGWCVNKNRH